MAPQLRPKERTDRYDVDVGHAESGPLIYRLDDKRAGEIYIAVRGTDQLIPFWVPQMTPKGLLVGMRGVQLLSRHARCLKTMAKR